MKFNTYLKSQIITNLILINLVKIFGYDFDYNNIADILPNMTTIKNNFKNIQNGKFKFWQTTDCLSILYEESPFAHYDGCYFQNPDAPYGLILFPLHKNEIQDKYFGFPILDSDNYSATWHMKKNEAIILLGVTPPTCRYFSFSNYLYSRHYPKDWKPEPGYNDQQFFLNCPDGDISDRCEIFASLDDSVNLDRGLNLNSKIFNSSFALILAQSQEATEYALQGLVEAGIDKSLISNYSFPASELNLGVNTNDDTFMTVMRTAFYINTTEASEYFDQKPFRVLRMELKNDDVTLYKRKELVDRNTKYDDATKANITLQQMKNVVKNVAVSIVKNMTGTKDYIELLDNWHIQVTETVSGAPDNGFECINKGRMCLADCRDTLYPFSAKIYRDAQICQMENITCNGVKNGKLTYNESDVILTVGVNHVLTGLSSYTSISIYDATYLWGVYTAGDTDLEDTVWNYIDIKDYDNDIFKNALPYIYVYEIRRDCQNIKNCIQVPSKPTTDVKAVIPINDPVVITERMYNNPITHVGPALENVILPITIHLKSRK
jgi:hypothetical protein